MATHRHIEDKRKLAVASIMTAKSKGVIYLFLLRAVVSIIIIACGLISM